VLLGQLQGEGSGFSSLAAAVDGEENDLKHGRLAGAPSV
jgi:hypothetical protein